MPDRNWNITSILSWNSEISKHGSAASTSGLPSNQNNTIQTTSKIGESQNEEEAKTKELLLKVWIILFDSKR